MIYLLYGKDTYRLKKKIEEMIGKYKEKHKNCFNLKLLEGDKLSYQDFKEGFLQMPMFKEKKLIIIKNVFSNQDFKKSFLENYKKFITSDDIIVFIEEKEILARDALLKILKKEAKVQEFNLLKGAKLTLWILKELGNFGIKADSQAIDKLLIYTGDDLWQIANEINKIAAFKKNTNNQLTSKDVSLLVRPKIEADIFKTIDAIAQNDKEKAFILLHKHLEKGDSPLYLLSMINFQFRNILTIKDLIEKGKPLSQAKLHPFVARKSQQQSQKFSLEDLKKIYLKIFKADFNIKTGKIEAETALDLLVAEI